MGLIADLSSAYVTLSGTQVLMTSIATAALDGGGSGGAVASFNGREGVIILEASDINTALGGMPASAAALTAETARAQAAETSLAASISAETLRAETAESGKQAAIAASAGLVLFGPPAAGAAPVPVTLGANLSLSGTTLNATAGAGGVSSFNTRTGAIVLTAADVDGAIGFTPASSTALTAEITRAEAAEASLQTSINTNGSLISAETARAEAAEATKQPAIAAASGLVLFGPAAAGGAPVPVTLGTNLTLAGGTLSAAGGTSAVTSVVGQTGVVTAAQIESAIGLSGYQPTIAAAAGELLAGPATAGGAPVPIVLGTNLGITAGTLNATAGGGGVSSFNTRTGAIVLTAADVEGALTFTPASVGALSGYQPTIAAAAGSILGAPTTAGGAPVDLAVGQFITISGGSLSATGLQPQIPVNAGQILLSPTTLGGAPVPVIVGANLAVTGGSLVANIGVSTIAGLTGSISAGALETALSLSSQFQSTLAAGAGFLLEAPSAAGGAPTQVTLGSGLSLSGTTLLATATGVTNAQLTAVVAALPTALPSAPGTLWLNGGVLQLS